LVHLNQQLQADIQYAIRMKPGVQTPEETMARACGSCRDTGWLMVQVFRHLGLAARFVSGYLIQLKADVKSIDGPSGAEKDVTDLHAWCEVFLPGAGWVGLDPTSGLMASEGHIPLACTPDPSGAAPIEGGFLHFGQGKWYPGQQLPRWALSILWRQDGQPIWQNSALLDFDPTNDPSPGEDDVTLATGRDFLDVSPLRGVIRGGARHTLNVAVTVTPMNARELVQSDH
jgi:transglutaminase-like putative cysteine protease